MSIYISSESDSDNNSTESFFFSVDSAYFDECISEDNEGELTTGVSLEKGSEAFVLLPSHIEAGAPCQAFTTIHANTSSCSLATGHAAQPKGSAPAPAVQDTVATLRSSRVPGLATGSFHSHYTSLFVEPGPPAAAGAAAALRTAKIAQGAADADAAAAAAGQGAAGQRAECEMQSIERSRISYKDLGQVSAPPKAVSRSAAQGNVFCSGVSPSPSFLSPAVRPGAAPREALGCPSQGSQHSQDSQGSQDCQDPAGSLGSTETEGTSVQDHHGNFKDRTPEHCKEATSEEESDNLSRLLSELMEGDSDDTEGSKQSDEESDHLSQLLGELIDDYCQDSESPSSSDDLPLQLEKIMTEDIRYYATAQRLGTASTDPPPAGLRRSAQPRNGLGGLEAKRQLISANQSINFLQATLLPKRNSNL